MILDGHDPVDACFNYAGILRMCPYNYTLAELWKMQLGFRRMMREHALTQACLVWEDGSIDAEAFIDNGIFHKAVREKILVSPEREKAIREIIEESKKHGGLIQVKPKAPLPPT